MVKHNKELFLLCMLMIPIAFAAAPSDPTFYYNMDEGTNRASILDSVSSLNMSGELLTAHIGDIINNSYNWTGELISTNTFFRVNTSTGFAFCLRFLTDRQSADQYFFEVNNDTDDTLINFVYKSTGALNFAYRDDANAIKSVITTQTYPADGNPHLVCGQRADSIGALQLWVDGVLRENSTAQYGSTALGLENGNWGVGENPTAGGDFFGLMDELYFFGRELTHDEMVAFNTTATVSDAGLTISAANAFNSGSISDFNVTISNSTYSETVESNFTTGMSFFANITDGNYTINVSNPQFFNLSYVVELLGDNYTIQSNLTQSYVLVEAYRALTGIRVNESNASIGSQTNSTINGTSYLIAAGGTHTLSWNAANYWPEAYSVTYSNLSYNYFRFNVTSLKLNLTAKNYGNTINNFTTTISRLNGDFTQDESNSTISGVSAFNIEPGQYNISIVADGYAFDSQVVTFNNTQTFHLINFTLLQTNTFNLSFYDEVLKTLIDDATITFELISNTYSENYTTTNGTLEINLLVPESYTLRYSGNPDYPQRFNYFELENGTYNQLSFYLLNTSSATSVTATVYDENNLLVEGAQIKSLRYDIDSNSYILQEIVSTNFEGEAILSMQLNTEYYKFIILYNGVQKLETTPTYVTSNTITFSIVLAGLAGEDYFTYAKVSSDIYFNNNTNNFVFTYNDASNTASQGCMYVYRLLTSSDVLVNSSCANTATGSIVLGVDAANNTKYRADGYITINGIAQYLGSAEADFTTSYPLQTAGDGILIWLLFIVFGTVAIFNLTLSLLLSPLALVLGSLLGMLNIPLWSTLGLYALSIILAVVISGRN